MVTDNGSTDNTHSILDGFMKDGKLTWYKGEGKGRTKSYWELLEKAGEADYYAFAEQDDIWKPGKLSRAVKYLETKAIIEGEETELADRPMMYCGEFEAVNSMGKPIGFKRNPANKFVDFEHSLVFDSRPGGTYVFNKRALDEMKKYDINSMYEGEYETLTRNILYLTGDVIFDRVPAVLCRKDKLGPEYRGGFMGMIRLFIGLYTGKVLNKKSKTAKALLDVYADDISDANKKYVLNQVGNYIADSAVRDKLVSNSKFATGSYVDKWFKSAVKSNKL